MRLFFLLFCLFSLNAFAYRDAYTVVGRDQNGVLVHGVIYTTDEPVEVEGNLIDSNGNKYDYWGRWNGPHQVTGQTSEGEVIDLRTF